MSLAPSDGSRLWHGDITSPFPPSGNEGYVRNRDVPYLSVTTSYDEGSYGKRHNLNPVTTLWHADADKRARDRQMPCERSQPSRRPSANSLTLVPAGTTEYIAAGDSQAAVPLPRSRKGFRPSMKDASRLSCLLLQLGSNDGEASLPEKGATEATSCPKGGTMWRH